MFWLIGYYLYDHRTEHMRDLVYHHHDHGIWVYRCI